MFSFARIIQLWLAAAPVKAPDELAALDLDRRLASPKSPDIRAKENIRYELTQPQQLLTLTDLLMEGQPTLGARPEWRAGLPTFRAGAERPTATADPSAARQDDGLRCDLVVFVWLATLNYRPQTGPRDLLLSCTIVPTQAGIIPWDRCTQSHRVQPPMTRPTLATIAPSFIAAHVPTTIAFYRDYLGFEIEYRDPEDDPFFAILRRDSVMIFFKAHESLLPMPNSSRHPWIKWDAYVSVPDPDALATEFAGRGVTFHSPLGKTSEGLRGFEVRDPNGYVLFFGRPDLVAGPDLRVISSRVISPPRRPADAHHNPSPQIPATATACRPDPA